MLAGQGPQRSTHKKDSFLQAAGAMTTVTINNVGALMARIGFGVYYTIIQYIGFLNPVLFIKGVSKPGYDHRGCLRGCYKGYMGFGVQGALYEAPDVALVFSTVV